ncbi:endogenous retrovirus group K member 21 Pro protein-like [Heterocephalus glaber]|uniref:human endogenous retrovirus K endopeptidase n=1 Tax=Heterocephalus glaber TaxID=10181 RepID=A0AAX6R6G8_HETGA|nr:endogenous retrovirus group K member 21 Pro protein-like [Heterocephalus glaber]
MTLIINGKSFLGLLGTGADISIFRSDHWPSSWPKHVTQTHLQGIGHSRETEQSAAVLQWTDPEGHRGYFQPYILEGLPVNLWGGDVMKDMGVYLYSPNPQVTQQMLNQGFVPGHGLGKQSQGLKYPVVSTGQPNQAGFGYF